VAALESRIGEQRGSWRHALEKRGKAMKIATQKNALLTLGTIIVLFFAAQSPAQQFGGSSQDPLAGSRVFGNKGCSQCHAVNGVGGKIATDLGRIAKPRTFYDLASAMWNHMPEMAAQMRKLNKPPPQLSARETGDLIAFLATINYFDPGGDAKAGKKIFADKQCVVCHQIERVGGVFGPSLVSVVQFGPIFFAATMWNHGPSMAQAMQARGIKRPQFSGNELRDLIAYVKSVSSGRGDQPMQVLPGRVEDGERLFAARGCVDCHGIRGAGGPVAPALSGKRIYSSLFEFAAAMWNKGPLMMREMQRRAITVPPLHADELAAIVGFLYSVEYFTGPGDPRRGEEIVTAKGCLACHSIGGKGGRLAPDFEKIQGLNEPANVVAAMWNHGAAMEQKMGDDKLPWPVFKGDEFTQVVGFLQALGRRRR
ncbi:MAG: c-type cytochrome, partial [Candidatus Binatia bacterium]